MTSTAIRWLAAVFAVVLSAEAAAQRGRRPRGMPPAVTAAPRFPAFRLPSTTPRPPDDGIIHWNTPNKDGNLGGPGTGGGGGGG
jgi:hypothetical protein